MSPRLVFVCLGVLGAKTPHPRMCCERQVFNVVPELSDTETEMFGITLNEKGPM